MGSDLDEVDAPVDWVAVWPVVRRRLITDLERLGRSTQWADDVVQDVAEKLLHCHTEFATADDLYRWARRVARNRRIDLIRRNAHLDTVAGRDVAATESVEETVISRTELAHVARAMAAMRESDRVALLASPTADDPAERNRANVRRFRARARLIETMTRVPAVGLVLGRAARRVRYFAGTAAVTATAALVVVGLPDVGNKTPAPEENRAFVPPACCRLPENPTRSTAASHAPDAARVRPPAVESIRPRPVADSGEAAVRVPLPTGGTVEVSSERVPDSGPGSDPPTACVSNVPAVGAACVDRPGPAIDELPHGVPM